MKIAIIADTHGIFKELFDKYQNELAQVNIVFLLGDYYKSEIQIMNNFFKVPMIGIHGNHDNMDVFDDSNVIDMHLQLAELNNGITITGFQGSSKYKQTQYYGYTQEEAQSVIKELPKADILISHDGPMGYCGNIDDMTHCGLQAITDYIVKYQPKLVFFGHHHKNKQFIINQTTCFNIYEIGIFEIDNNINVINYYNYNL